MTMSLAPFLIGLAGSVHCMGMCGPLSSLVSNTGKNPLWRSVFYNGGRIITYGLLGAIISFVSGIASLYGIQVWLSLAVGVVLILFGVTGTQVIPPRFISKPMGVLSGFLKTRFTVLMSMKTSYGILVMGMINGLLPCGMTWLALGYCVTLQWPLDGFLSMILFGLGTVPAMIGFSTIVGKLTTRFRVSFKSIQTVLLIISGCLLIARSFSSPESPAANGIVICGSHTTTQK